MDFTTFSRLVRHFVTNDSIKLVNVMVEENTSSRVGIVTNFDKAF